MKAGVDSGGTFTDFVLLSQTGELFTFKLPSTPDDPARAILEGLQQTAVAEQAQRTVTEQPKTVAHGTTVATNALLERNGANVAFVTTAGFEDLLDIGRQNRADLYALVPQKPAPLATVNVGVQERVSATGEVLTPLAPPELDDAFDGIDAIAICLLHADLHPDHERRLARRFRDAGFNVSVSHEIANEFREFERGSTTVINAYVSPTMQRYLGRLETELDASLQIIGSDGQTTPVNVALKKPVTTLLSGPAGGVVAADAVANKLGRDKIITVDMGGTSTDVSLIAGKIQHRRQSEIGGFPIRAPFIDIHTVGAGGGSIAYVDDGGALRVGPRSAGADPGPVCYGNGGTEPTVTDAHLYLGRLPPTLLGGDFELDVTRAHAAIEALAQTIGLPPRQTALGILDVVETTMVRAIKNVSVARGHDTKEFSLLAYGGAGGLHACRLAEALGIETVIVPKNAGVFSAVGCLIAASGETVAHSVSAPISKTLCDTLNRISDVGAVKNVVGAFHYRGQSHALEFEVQRWDHDAVIASFHQHHESNFGYRETGIDVICDCVYVTHENAPRAPFPNQECEHQSFLSAVEPRVIETYDATILVEPGWTAEKTDGHWVLTR